MSRESSLAKNTFIMSLGTILPKIAAIITLPIITDKLTKAEYGTYDLIITLVSLFLPIATLQVQTAAFRFLIDCKENQRGMKRIITNVVVFVIVTSIISLTLLYFALYKLSLSIRILICTYFFVDIIFLTLVQIVRGLSQSLLYSLCTSIQPVVNMILVMIFVYWIDGGLIGALLAMTGATFVALIIVIVRGEILSKIQLDLLSLASVKELIAYSWPMIPNSLSMWMLHFSDRIVLLNYIGITATAIYGVANKIPSMYNLANSAFTLAWQENASITSNDDDVAFYYGKMFENITNILFGIMAGLIAITPVLFVFLIRGNYDEAYRQMPLLLMSMFFSSISSFLGGIYVAHKKTKSVGGTTITAGVLNLIIDFALVKEVGIYAASISTLVSYVFLAIYRMQNVQQFQKIMFNLKKMLFCIGVLAIMCVMLWLNKWYLNIVNAIMGCTLAIIINKELIKKIICSVLRKKCKS